MHDDLDAGRLGDLVKGIGLGDVRHDDDLETVGLVRVGVADLAGLVLGADRGDDGVALLEELLEDVRWTRLAVIRGRGQTALGEVHVPAMKPEPPVEWSMCVAIAAWSLQLTSEEYLCHDGGERQAVWMM